MKQFVINVPDDKQAFFEELMQNLDFGVSNASVVNEPVPEWHKEIVLNRMASSSEDDYIPWEQAKLNITRKNK